MVITRPLVIVDGVNIGNDLSIIDPNDIQKMDIIKGCKYCNIWCARC